jgi:hypothetical protein
MNVIQRPREREFCGTMQDYIIDTDVTIAFAVKYGGKKILDEEYVPDANNQVRIRRLGKFCELALWGVWCSDSVLQSNASGTFTFLINDIEDTQSLVIFSRLQTKKDAFSPGVLSEVSSKVTRLGAKEYVSGYPLNGGYGITAAFEDGTQEKKSFFVSSAVLFTVDVSPDIVFQKFSRPDIVSYTVDMLGGSMLFYVDGTRYVDLWCFRFKNVYDMPETLTATGELKLAGNNESDAAAMYGVQRKFGIKVTDEYTAGSGSIMLQSDYKLWHNMLNAQEVEILADGEWLPVVITKQKFERSFRRSVLKAVEFNFTMANPEQNNLIGL